MTDTLLEVEAGDSRTYPQTGLTEQCDECDNVDVRRYNTGPNTTWMHCVGCGKLLGEN